MNKKEFGNIGENIAVDYLRANGFRILERNFRCRMGEIDIIANKGRDVYFVEVKARKNKKYGDPLESITLRKQRQIVKIARYFIAKHKKEVNYHFSVMGIIIDGTGQPSILFLPDAFRIV